MPYLLFRIGGVYFVKSKFSTSQELIQPLGLSLETDLGGNSHRVGRRAWEKVGDERRWSYAFGIIWRLFGINWDFKYF